MQLRFVIFCCGWNHPFACPRCQVQYWPKLPDIPPGRKLEYNGRTYGVTSPGAE